MSQQVMVCPSCECSNTGPFRWCVMCIEERGWQAYALDLQERLKQQEQDTIFMRDMMQSKIAELEEQLQSLTETAKRGASIIYPCILGD